MCVGCRATPCAWLQEAMSLRKWLKGHLVVKSLLMPASVAVLSVPEGTRTCKWLWLWPVMRCVHCKRANWARVSKLAMYRCAGLVRKGHVFRISSIDQVSPNQAAADPVMTHPPMPTVWPSAHASAAGRHCGISGMASGLCGECPSVCMNHLRLSVLSRRSRVCVASGSVALTNWILAEEWICGRSALTASLAPLYSKILAPDGMCRPRGQLGSVKSSWRLDKKVCHCVAGMAYWLPGGLWRSE